LNTNSTILAIDDTPENLGLLETILEVENFKVLVATSGRRGLEIAQKQQPDLILLDINMPEWSGFETAKFIQQESHLKNIPILFLSALDDTESKVKALKSGGVDYISKPFNRLELLARVKTHIELSQLRNNLQAQVEQKTEELRHAYEESLTLLSVASEYRDYETGLHNSRLGLYAALLANKLAWSSSDCETILYAAPLHDVGKIGITDNILHKPGPLNAEEWVIMKTHATIGEKILSSKSHNNALFAMAAEIAGGHHEGFNGLGYPRGVSGHDIPLSARITAICDVYDALRSKRPYKESYTHNKSMDMILNGDARTKSEQFDPEILELFKQHADKFEHIFETTQETSDISLIKRYNQLKNTW